MSAPAPSVDPRSVKTQFSIDWLDYHARYDAENLAAVDLETGRRFTYREFHGRLRRLASGFQKRFGVKKGDRVAVLANNSSDLFEILFACWEVGAAMMPLNWRLSRHEID